MISHSSMSHTIGHVNKILAVLRKAVTGDKNKYNKIFTSSAGQPICYHITETMNDQYFANESS